MMEGEDTGWIPVIEKKGLHQETEILENYGIDSESDVSVSDRDDFSKLTSRVECLDRGDRGGTGEGVGRLVLYEIAL